MKDKGQKTTDEGRRTKNKEQRTKNKKNTIGKAAFLTPHHLRSLLYCFIFRFVLYFPRSATPQGICIIQSIIQFITQSITQSITQFMIQSIIQSIIESIIHSQQKAPSVPLRSERTQPRALRRCV